MIETSSFKKGVCLVYKGAPMMITDVNFSTPTVRGSNTIAKTKLRNMLTGQIINDSIRSGERLEEVDLERHPASYMYSDGTRWHFIDDETFEQFDLGADELGDSVAYLKDGLEGLQSMIIDGRVINVTLPLAVELEVVETEPAIKGSTVSNVGKPATMETGLIVQVPPFINQGDVIKIDTSSGAYVERVTR